MPFLATEPYPAFYRHWPVPDAKAGIVFLHGIGEHSGLYERLAGALQSHGIEVWALDHLGHGHTGQSISLSYDIEALARNAEALLSAVAAERPELPLALVGHSLGGVTASVLLSTRTLPVRGAVLTGTPFAPVALAAMEIDPSHDAAYLEALQIDPLVPKEEIDPEALAEGLRRAHEIIDPALAGWSLPVLLINGDGDQIAPARVARERADAVADARSVAIAGSLHDVLNDVSHAEVATIIAGFALSCALRPADT